MRSLSGKRHHALEMEIRDTRTSLGLPPVATLDPDVMAERSEADGTLHGTGNKLAAIAEQLSTDDSSGQDDAAERVRVALEEFQKLKGEMGSLIPRLEQAVKAFNVRMDLQKHEDHGAPAQMHEALQAMSMRLEKLSTVEFMTTRLENVELEVNQLKRDREADRLGASPAGQHFIAHGVDEHDYRDHRGRPSSPATTQRRLMYPQVSGEAESVSSGYPILDSKSTATGCSPWGGLLRGASAPHREANPRLVDDFTY